MTFDHQHRRHNNPDKAKPPRQAAMPEELLKLATQIRQWATGPYKGDEDKPLDPSNKWSTSAGKSPERWVFPSGRPADNRGCGDRGTVSANVVVIRRANAMRLSFTFAADRQIVGQAESFT